MVGNVKKQIRHITVMIVNIRANVFSDSRKKENMESLAKKAQTSYRKFGEKSFNMCAMNFGS